MMICNVCGEEAEVIDSRIVSNYVRRRRKCRNNHRFTTYEIDQSKMDQLRKMWRLVAQIKNLSFATDQLEIEE